MNGFQLISSRTGAVSMAVLASLVFSTSCGGGSAAALPNDNINPPAANQTTVRNGVTSAFGIPAGLEGNVSTGEGLFTANCSGCHGSKMGARDFTAITAALGSVGAMKSINLSQQQQADITAYLNRASIPPVVNPPADPNPPTPPTTPTPPATGSDSLTGFGIPAGLSGSISAGQLVWTNSCTACHSNKDGRSFGTLESALLNVGSMRSIKLSQQELADLTAYLNRGSGGGGVTPGTGSGDDDEGDDSLDDDSNGSDDSSIGDDDGDGSDDSSIGGDDGDDSSIGDDDGDDTSNDDENDDEGEGEGEDD